MSSASRWVFPSPGRQSSEVSPSSSLYGDNSGYCVDTGEYLGNSLTKYIDTFVGVAGPNHGVAPQVRVFPPPSYRQASGRRHLPPGVRIEHPPHLQSSNGPVFRFLPKGKRIPPGFYRIFPINRFFSRISTLRLAMRPSTCTQSSRKRTKWSASPSVTR